jgi:hypothetical protein
MRSKPRHFVGNDEAYYVMVKRSNIHHPYVVATWNVNCKTEWMWGHYFQTLKEAEAFWHRAA